jgi:alkanesulfonate monooxygenase SsuD/methylene tetrahydromethanopterin reductase-like flavin-dependent oxidoreductase (luciferase family)
MRSVTAAAAALSNTALLAKTAASIDAISGGRLSLGLAVGAREEDYTLAGVDYRTRGRRLSEQLGALRDLWEDESIGPRPVRPAGPELLVGGLSDQAYARVARYADGYVHGGGPPRAFARSAERARAAWSESSRPGRPRLWGQAYFAFGDEDVLAAGAAYLRHYYAFTGPFAERVVAGLLTTPQALAQLTRGYAEAGCEDLVLLPTVSDSSQIDRLADVLASLGDLQTAEERAAAARPAEGTAP